MILIKRPTGGYFPSDGARRSTKTIGHARAGGETKLTIHCLGCYHQAIKTFEELRLWNDLEPLEAELPDLGLLVFEDAETGEQLFVDTHDGRFRKRFMDAAGRREAALRGALADAGVDALELSTEIDLVDTVLRFANLRKRKGTVRVNELPVA